MKKQMMKWMMFALSVCLLTTLELDAIGGRGGGRGGGGARGGGGLGGGRSMHGGGHARQGNSVNRGHSMSRSRPQTRPSQQRPQQKRKPAATRKPTKPSTRDLGKRPTNKSIENFLGQKQKRPAARPEGRPGADRPGRPVDRPRPELPGDRPGRPADRPRPELPGERPGRPGDRPGRPGDRPGQRPGDRWQDKGDRIRESRHDRLHDHFDDDHWWRRAGWAAAIGWAGWNWGTPYYYGYTDDGGWGYYDDTGYSDDVSAPSYSEQSEAISSASDADEVADEDWLPLGMFALTSPDDSSAPPNGYIQLSLSKDGQLSGYYYNSTADKSYEVEGRVDQETQIAAWQMAESENSPIVETGIFNLTQEEAPARVHFADGRTQNMLLVALEDDGS